MNHWMLVHNDMLLNFFARMAGLFFMSLVIAKVLLGWINILNTFVSTIMLI